MPNALITIRPCTPKDIDILLSLGVKTFRDTFEEFNTQENMELYMSETFSPERIAQEFNEPGAVFFMALDDDHVVGYAKVRAHKKPELNGHTALEIERLYARTEYIGKGIGWQLMQACLEHAKDNGYNVVWLGVWEHNIRAIEFYRKWGFEKFSHHTFMLGRDAQIDHLMKKKI